MAIVIGASPLLNPVICWGTLSSSTRKDPLGISGMKWPLLSITATSTVTWSTSVLKVCRLPTYTLSFLVYSEGILGRSPSVVDEPSAGFFFATVPLEVVAGPVGSCANTIPASAATSARAHRIAIIEARIGVLSEVTIPDDVLERESVSRQGTAPL